MGDTPIYGNHHVKVWTFLTWSSAGSMSRRAQSQVPFRVLAQVKQALDQLCKVEEVRRCFSPSVALLLYHPVSSCMSLFFLVSQSLRHKKSSPGLSQTQSHPGSFTLTTWMNGEDCQQYTVPPNIQIPIKRLVASSNISTSDQPTFLIFYSTL